MDTGSQKRKGDSMKRFTLQDKRATVSWTFIADRIPTWSFSHCLLSVEHQLSRVVQERCMIKGQIQIVREARFSVHYRGALLSGYAYTPDQKLLHFLEKSQKFRFFVEAYPMGKNTRSFEKSWRAGVYYRVKTFRHQLCNEQLEWKSNCNRKYYISHMCISTLIFNFVHQNIFQIQEFIVTVSGVTRVLHCIRAAG